VLVDTAGCVSYSAFETLAPFVDGYLFDFKTADAEKYRDIGGDLTLVSENISSLIRDGKNIRIRIPLIPDFNTDRQ
jgi:pyruvate formate lyase activating enzyme